MTELNRWKINGRQNAAIQIANLMRLDFDQFGILLALMASGRSGDLFYTHVGGVSFDKNKRILAVCYNGFAPGQDLDVEFLKDREKKNNYVFHSEENLLSQTKIGEVDTMFVTHSPCHNCARLIAANQVKNVVFLEEYHKETRYKDVFEFYGVKWKQIDKDSLVQCLKFLDTTRSKLKEIIKS